MPDNLISRWIFSPLESVPSPMLADAAPENVAALTRQYPPADLPVCRQYAANWNAPWHENGSAMVLCAMDPTHLAAAQADPRLIVLDSISGKTPAPAAVVTWVNGLKTVQSPSVPQATPVPSTATLADILTALEHLHVDFMPEQ